MTIKNFLNRRNFLGSAGVLGGMMLSARRVLGLTALLPAPAQQRLTGFGATGNVYEELGVTTVINGQGTMTYLGGSLPRPEVAAVMALAAEHFVSIVELEQAAGKRVVELLKLPADYDAIVTCGAAAGMQSGLAGILTGNNPKFIEQLPDLAGMKSEVIIQKSHRNGFDHQLRATGVKLVEVESREDVKRAINSQTAMMHFSNFANAAGQIKVDEWVKLAHENQIPAFNDGHAALDKEWWRRLDAVSAEVARVPGVATSFNVPDVANHVPHMRIFWDPRKISLSPHDAASALRNGKPSIVLGSSEGGLGMNSFMLKPGEEKIIAAQLVQLFKSHTA